MSSQQWELQQQVDVSASHLEKERHQLAEQIKKVSYVFMCSSTSNSCLGSLIAQFRMSVDNIRVNVIIIKK